jgi:diazepam-binding inhibitor (GABA receptor modulator, acyl-CoA-binding protein)
MELIQQFEQAVAESKMLSRKPDNETLLNLYALYKQATAGDVSGEAPSNPFDFVAKAKYNAWSDKKGKTKDDAMNEYIAIVAKLKSE